MRPSAHPDTSTVTRGISLPCTLNQRLVAQACREDRSVSSLIRNALRDYLASREPVPHGPRPAVRVRAAAHGETHDTQT